MEIIEATYVQNKSNQNVKLNLIGSPSNQIQEKYAVGIKSASKAFDSGSWIKFTNAISRENIPNFLASQDVFVHGYQGSLDKTLIEATLIGLPVVTLNQEYLQIFGSWLPGDLDSISLATELNFLNEMDVESRLREVVRRQKLAFSDHTLIPWAKKLSDLLNKAIIK
jgi:hypothetical protein